MSGQRFQVLERYILGSPIASGGMATVYLGRPVSLPRVVAIKQLEPQLAADPTFVRMFLDEVQLLSRIRHKNVVAPIEHFQARGEFFIVMEYVEGLSLSQLVSAANGPVDARLASRIVADVLTGLDAAHEAIDCAGQPLNLVHRDVSPHNILVGADGETRIVDFGIAKAAWRVQVTQHGQRKGKPGYMAPEQLTLQSVDRRTDVYAAGIVLWELLTGVRLFRDRQMDGVSSTLGDAPSHPSSFVPELPPELDQVVLRALSAEPENRFKDARSMAGALMNAVAPARDFEVGAWTATLGRRELKRRGELIAELESLRLGDLTQGGLPGPGRQSIQVDVAAAGLEAGSVDAFASGYASGKNVCPNAENAEVLTGRRHGVRAGHVAAVALTMTAGLLGASYVVRSRALASNPPERSPSMETKPSHLVVDSALSSAVTTSGAAQLTTSGAVTPISDAPSSSAPPVPPPARVGRASGTPNDARTPPVASALPTRLNHAEIDVQPPTYDPLFDGRRR